MFFFDVAAVFFWELFDGDDGIVVVDAAFVDGLFDGDDGIVVVDAADFVAVICWL